MPDDQHYTDQRIKHLEMIQAVVARLANEAALIRGWSLTVAAAFYAYSAEAGSWQVAIVGIVAVAVFWALNAYYLQTERRFRCLFDRARDEDQDVPLFTMNIQAENPCSRSATAFSSTLLLFYGFLMLIGVVLVVVGLLDSASQELCIR